jgi:hypothetical protein
MKVDVNLASRDPLKFIDSVLAHHGNDNRDIRVCTPVREMSTEGDMENWNFKLNKIEV